MTIITATLKETAAAIIMADECVYPLFYSLIFA